MWAEGLETTSPRSGEDLSSCSLFSWLDQGLLGDVDTIQELSVILWTGFADLVGASSAERHCSVVWSFEDELVLDLVGWGHSDFGTTEHGDELVLLSSQEVLDEETGSILGGGGVDWEMRVGKSHLVSEALSIV